MSMKMLLLTHLLAAVFVSAQFIHPNPFHDRHFGFDPFHDMTLDECMMICEMNTCEEVGHPTMSSDQMLSCTNACYMRHIGVSKNECLDHCDRHGQSGCNLVVNEVMFDLCLPRDVRGSSCGRTSTSDCELGCETYPEAPEIGDQCVKHAERGPFGMEVGSCCGLPGEISCGPGYTAKPPAIDVCGGSCPENWCNHQGVLKNVREYTCEPSEFVQVYGEGSCETLLGYKTIMDVETCELAAKFLEKQVTTVNVNKFVPDNRPAGCTYHQDENLQLWTESRGACTFGDGCLCEVTENLIGDKCIKHADRGPLEMEIGSCCGRPGRISCGPGYVLQAPFPDVCGGSCPENWCNHHGVLAETRSFSCVPEEPSTPTLNPTIEPTEAPEDSCVPYSPEQCRIAAKALGLLLGGKGYAFEGDYRQKGCYAYTSGKYAGRAYYGLGGSDAEITDPAPFRPETFRPSGWDCNNVEYTFVGNSYCREVDENGDAMTPYMSWTGTLDSVKECDAQCKLLGSRACRAYDFNTSGKCQIYERLASTVKASQPNRAVCYTHVDGSVKL